MKSKLHCATPSYTSGLPSTPRPRRKMRSQFVFVAFMVFVSIAYYIVAFGQPTNGTLQHTVALALGGNTGSDDAVTTAAYNGDSNSSSSSSSATDSSFVANVSKEVTISPSNDYVLNKPDLCQSDKDFLLLIMVVTAPANAELRQSIRLTWGTIGHRDDVRLAFVLGVATDAQVQQRIVAEDATYGDIVQGNFIDAYYNLTLKSTLILRWSEMFCSRALFVLKIDDDCFMNPENLLKFLSSRKKDESAIYGRLWKKVKPIRDKNHKWSVSTDAFPGKEYPDYTGGPSYVITRAAVPVLLRTAGQMKAKLDLEDVFITGICAEKAKVPRVNDNRFNVADKPSTCSSRDVISYHHVTPDVMHMLWWIANDRKLEGCSAVVAKGKTCAQAKDKASKDKCAAKDRLHLIADLTNVILNNLHD